jgi:hypothetical protein
VIFIDVGDVVELAFVARLQGLVEAVGVVRQQSQQDVFLLADVGEGRHVQFRRRNEQRVPVLRARTEVDQLLLFQPQVAPAALQLVILQRQIDAIPIESREQRLIQLALVAGFRRGGCALVLAGQRFDARVQVEHHMGWLDLALELSWEFRTATGSACA